MTKRQKTASRFKVYPYVLEVRKKSPQIVSKFVFYLLIPYKKFPKMPKLTKNDDGKWVQYHYVPEWKFWLGF